jgi:hypothetical protein
MHDLLLRVLLELGLEATREAGLADWSGERRRRETTREVGVHADDVELGGHGGLLVAGGELQRCVEDVRDSDGEGKGAALAS